MKKTITPISFLLITNALCKEIKIPPKTETHEVFLEKQKHYFTMKVNNTHARTTRNLYSILVAIL